jgi:D-alanyl-D-alanine carboxypeptidase (penicillin-binding protein 5/6)
MTAALAVVAATLVSTLGNGLATGPIAGPVTGNAPATSGALDLHPVSAEAETRSRRTTSGMIVRHRTTYRPVGHVRRPPAIRARAWAIVDMGTGRILGFHHHRRYLPQASTIKLLTAVTASHRVAVHPRHRVTRAEAHPQYCTCVGLKVGRRYSRAALLAGMLLPSGNDAALALAGSDPDGRPAFITAMNARARRLGATDTHVVTPNGLTARGAHSSARDLLVFLRAAERNGVVAPYLSKRSAMFGPVNGRKHRIYNATDYVMMYPGSQGKSGYTTPAKNTLVVSTHLYGHHIGVATLGAPGGYSTSGARSLTVWAARNFAHLRRVGHLPPPLQRRP